MIAHDSKSYPYLAIAQHHNVPYAEVLRYSEILLKGGKFNAPPFSNWRMAVWLLEQDKR